MKKISRYILVFITVLAASVALPNLYWLAFEKPVLVPFLMYSSLENEFYVQHNTGGELIRSDLHGNTLTRDQFEQKLPIFFIRQLIISGTMPDTINGVAMDVHEVNRSKSTFRYRPRDIYTPEPGLYPLFESESGRANLEMPQDYFRITDRMEFVDAKENMISERKSQMFTTVLNNREFKFPAKKIAGIPTTRKSCDEGYFVVDQADDIYHVKMIEGEPYVKKIDVEDGLKFKHIACVDFSDKKYYCYLISEENELYILTQDDYEFIKWPLEGFDPDQDELRIYGNLFNYTLISRREGGLKALALDNTYRVVDEYEETWPSRNESKQGVIASYIFPAQLSLSDSNSDFINFFVKPTKNFHWLFLNILLVLGQVFIIRKSGFKLQKNLIDLGIIAITGVYGFIAVNFFQNKFFD